MSIDELILNDEKRNQLDKNIKMMISEGVDEKGVMAYAKDFKSKYGEKKKEQAIPFDGQQFGGKSEEPLLPLTSSTVSPSVSKQPKSTIPLESTGAKSKQTPAFNLEKDVELLESTKNRLKSYDAEFAKYREALAPYEELAKANNNQLPEAQLQEYNNIISQLKGIEQDYKVDYKKHKDALDIYNNKINTENERLKLGKEDSDKKTAEKAKEIQKGLSGPASRIKLYSDAIQNIQDRIPKMVEQYNMALQQGDEAAANEIQAAIKADSEKLGYFDKAIKGQKQLAEIQEPNTFANRIANGFTRAGGFLAGGVNFVDDAVNQIQTEIMGDLGFAYSDKFKKEFEDFKNSKEYSSLERPSDKIAAAGAKLMKEASEKSELMNMSAPYQGGVFEAIKAGDFEIALTNAAKAFTESFPTSVLMISNPFLASAGMAQESVNETEGAVTSDDYIAGALKASFELAFENLFGTGKALKEMVSAIGRDAAIEATEKAVKHGMKELAKKWGVTWAEETLGEGATQLASNIVDKKMGKEIGYFDGVADASLIGSFGGLTQGTATTTLTHYIDRAKTREYESKKSQAAQLAERAAVERNPVVAEAIEAQAEKIETEAEKIAVEQNKIGATLPLEVLTKIEVLNSEIDELEVSLNEVEPDLIPIIEAQIEEKNNLINELAKQTTGEVPQESGKTENEIKVEELRAQEQAEKDATDPNDQEKLDEIYNRYNKLITPLLEGVGSEVKTQETISEAADSKGVYLKDGEYGVLRTDGQTVVFETNDKIFDLGNKDELSNASIADFGIEKEEPLNVQVNPDNSIVIDDVRFVNNFSEPQAAINTDADGNVVSVNLETEDGKKRTIRGQRAEEIAYQYKLKEFEQNATEESIARLEQEVTKLEGAAQEIKSQTKKRSAAKRKPKEVAQEQAATEIQVAPLPVEEEVKEREVSEAEVDSVAKNAGVTPKNIRDLYNIGRDLFTLNRVQALAQAVVMDKMIGAMAKRKGVKKSEIYKTIQFKKASEKDLPQEALKQTKEEILRVFHGTSKDKDFKKFKDTGKGIFVTISPKDASEYAEQNDSMKFGDYDPVTGKFKEINTASRVIPMNLKLGNVYKLSKEDLAFLNSKPNYSALQKQLHAQIKAQGFDTIDYGNGVYAVITEGRLNSMLTNEVLFQKDLPQGVKMQVDAWHGSPYEFDKFTTEKIGTGEGAQAFGWGLYFTDLESIARNYAEKLSKPNFNKFREKLLKDNPSRDVINDILDFSEYYDYNYNKVLDALTKNENKAAVDYLKENKDLFNSVERNLYKVSIQKGKDQSEYTWLEWDKPLGEKQKQLISKAIQDNYLDFTSSERENLSNLDGWDSASGLYMALDNILGSDKEASLFLLKAGINGIKYPAESISRGVTSDTARGFNYVVFDENAVSIEEVIKFQKDAVKARGAMMMNMDGQAVIYALSDPNVSTPLHELAHVFEHYLTESEKNEIIKAAGTKGWTIKTSEYFARGFEKYLADGKAPSKGLQKLFDKFKEWLTEIYNGITDSNIDVELNEKMEGIYSQMLGVAAKKKKKTPPQNVLDIAKETGLSPQEIENTYKKYDGTKSIEEITIEDYNSARAAGNEQKLENSKKAFEALLKADSDSPTAKKKVAKIKEEVSKETLKEASDIMNNIDNIRQQLLDAGVIKSINCKWG